VSKTKHITFLAGITLLGIIVHKPRKGQRNAWGILQETLCPPKHDFTGAAILTPEWDKNIKLPNLRKREVDRAIARSNAEHVSYSLPSGVQVTIDKPWEWSIPHAYSDPFFCCPADDLVPSKGESEAKRVTTSAVARSKHTSEVKFPT
jgi:hypothetical protein